MRHNNCNDCHPAPLCHPEYHCHPAYLCHPERSEGSLDVKEILRYAQDDKWTQDDKRGFTLLEILIALFIFSLISMILVSALRNVMDSQATLEQKAERLHVLQRVLLMMSRDIEQAVNRPILNTSGKEEYAFVGSEYSFALTHAGFANATQTINQSNLQRVQYKLQGHALTRYTWAHLDQSPESKPYVRTLISNIKDGQFEYLDHDGRFYNQWPLDQEKKQVLPRGIRVRFTFAGWGTLTQLYLIPAEVVFVPPEPPGKP